MTLHNAPPTHGQVTALAVILAFIVLFAAVFFAALLHAVRREQEDA